VARPKQLRSEETLFRLLDAAEALIEEKGLLDASIPEIVRRAGSSVGGFYARFKDKNELLRALEERFFGELGARVARLADRERWAEAPLDEILRACAAELVSVVRERRNLLAAFLYRALRDPEVREGGLRFRRRVSQQIGALLTSRREEMSHPDPELAVELGVDVALALMLQVVLVGDLHVAGRHVSDAELERELARLFLHYVGARESAPPRRRRT
jgi:AcrR family transcriptional regulator